MKRSAGSARAKGGSRTALVVVVLDDGSRRLVEIGCRGLGWFRHGMAAVRRQVVADVGRIAWVVLVDVEPCIYNAREAAELLGF